MSVFGNIMNKIFHHPKAQAAPQAGTPTPNPAPSDPAAAQGDTATLPRPPLRRRRMSTSARCWARWPR